jgi:hypothetical protein
VNHYLQRLALSAIKPGGTIHPALDSVYSTRRDQADRPWIEENTSVADAQAELAPVKPATSTVTPASQQTDAVTDVSPSPRPTFERIRPDMPELLLTRHSDLSVPGVMEPQGFISKGRADSTLDRENTSIPFPVSKDKAEGIGQVTQREHFSDPPWQTLIPTPESTTVQSPSRRPNGVAPSRNPALVIPELHKTKPQTEPFRRAKPGAREPDEIQIHIGRIEVTAVHPAPAPAAAKPQRNVPSLDEYLRRRDRRPS